MLNESSMLVSRLASRCSTFRLALVICLLWVSSLCVVEGRRAGRVGGQVAGCSAGMSFAAAIDTGNRFYEGGQMEAARSCYAIASGADPRSPLAKSNQGLTYLHSHPKKAMGYFRKALKIDPHFPDAYYAMGSLLYQLGKLEPAVASLRTSISMQPSFVAAYNNLANVYTSMQKLDLALNTYKRVRKLAPHSAEAHANSARILVAMGRAAEGFRSFDTALRLGPNNGLIYSEMGASLKAVRRRQEARMALRKAVELNGDIPDAYYNLGELYSGDIYAEDKDVPAAIRSHSVAVRLRPNYAEAYMSLGMLYWSQGQLPEAERLLENSLRSRSIAEAAANLGIIQSDMGKYDKSLESFRKAQKLAEGYKCMGDTLKHLNKWHEAIDGYEAALAVRQNYWEALNDLLHAVQHVCDWDRWKKVFRKVERVLAAELQAGNLPIFVKPFHALVYPLKTEHMLLVAKSYAARAVRLTRSLVPEPFTHDMSLRKKKILVGYVSSNIGDHSLSHLMQNIFGMHGKSVRVLVYALNPDDGSNYRRKIAGDVGRGFFDVSLQSGVGVAHMVNRHKVHVLVDLVGYTGGGEKANEVFAVKPAPHAFSYMGFCASSGADYMDHMVADAIVAPPEHRAAFSEKLMLLPPSYFVTDHKQSFKTLEGGGVGGESAADVGLPGGDAVIFACFNQLYKIDPGIFDVWMRVLHRVKNSYLWLLKFPPVAQDSIVKEANKRKIKANRLIFTDPVPKAKYLQRAKLADLFLDTPLVNAHTSATDVMWAGVPFVTLPGAPMIARVAGGLAVAAGLPELIVPSLEAYENLVVEMVKKVKSTSKKGGLSLIKRRLAGSRGKSPVFDTAQWTRSLDTLIKATWDSHLAKSPSHVILAASSKH